MFGFSGGCFCVHLCGCLCGHIFDHLCGCLCGHLQSCLHLCCSLYPCYCCCNHYHLPIINNMVFEKTRILHSYHTKKTNLFCYSRYLYWWSQWKTTLFDGTVRKKHKMNILYLSPKRNLRKLHLFPLIQGELSFKFI